jgi:hypothetical protein
MDLQGHFAADKKVILENLLEYLCRMDNLPDNFIHKPHSRAEVVQVFQFLPGVSLI